ncbi:MAG TPA: hypothetical protein VLM82_00770, partial [Acidobacteriota bacterium]|nr:hypothetical protein [Acidobacteriota bacterium]
KLKDSVSQWSLLSIIGFIIWTTTVVGTTFLTLTTASSISLWILFGFTGLPMILIALVYGYRALQNKKFSRIIVFPFIDLFRVLSFCAGITFQVLKRAQKPQTTT